jgi:Protein of unknown function (DUF2975)
MNANEISPKADMRMNRIKKVITIIRFLISSTVILGVVFGLLFLADLLGYPIVGPGVKISFSPLLTYTSPFKIPAIVLVLGFIRVGLFFAGILILFWLLDLFEAGKFFAAQNVQYIKLLGFLVIGDWVVTKILDAFAKSGMQISFGQLAVGLLVILISWIMDEGRKIQEEQELTV